MESKTTKKKKATTATTTVKATVKKRPQRHLEDLACMSTEELDIIFDTGRTPDFKKLSGWEFRGFNPPFFAKIAGIRKFKKGFFTKKIGDQEIQLGYNIPIVQNGINGPWLCKPSDNKPDRFGWYTVKPVDPLGKDNKYPHSVLLNYGEGDNSFFDGTMIIRDYVVQVDSDNEDLYLGKAYLAFGPLRVFSNYFILERHRESMELK